MEVLKKAYEARNKKLNKIEKIKELKNPQEAYDKIEQYAKDGYDSIPAEDKSYFLKCFGIYDRVATPQRFMIKLRIPGGQMTATQAIEIGKLAQEFGQDYIDLTTRAQCELRYLKIENMPELLRRLKDVELDAYQTGVDNIRGIMGDPFDDLAFDNILPSQNLILKLQETFLYNPQWISTLPRKFNTAVTGCLSNRCNIFGHDCCFVLAQKDGIFGYNMYLGGRVGHIASNADIFLSNEDEVLKAFGAITNIFKDYGFRDNRNKNRLHFLIQAVGINEISKAIREISKVDFLSAGETMTKMDYIEADNGKIQLKDGAFGVHAVIPSGVFTGSGMMQAGKISTKFGNGKIRLDMEQSLFILGIKDVNEVLKEEFFKKYKSVNTPYLNHLIACAGTEHCPFGVIENKNDAIYMSNYLDEKVPLEKGRVRMYWSACVKGCGIHGLGDIGFEGCKAKINGEAVSGVHILLGGKLLNEGTEGYTIIRSAPLPYAKLYMESLMIEYKRLRNHNEHFEQFHDRVLTNYTHAYIGFMLQLQAYLREKDIQIDLGFNIKVTTGKIEEFEVFQLGLSLYYLLSKNKAYSAVERFTHKMKNEKYEDIRKHDSSIDENLANMLEEILTHKEENRAVVFSQLMEFIAL